MTTKLEQEFFKVFGIKPYCVRSCVAYYLEQGIDAWEKFNCEDTDCDKYEHDKSTQEYPKITDRKLLEMICIINEFISMFNWKQIKYISTFKIETLKENILKDLIWILSNECNDVTKKQLKQQIQQLFEEKE